MPFLHWFKRKPETSTTEDQPVLAQNLAGEESEIPEADFANLRTPIEAAPPLPEPETHPEPIAQELVAVPKLAASEVKTSWASDIFVPIGAFYNQLPPHLLASEKPDLKRSVSIAEHDMYLDQGGQEATVALSILSLSCPDIFVRPVEADDDFPITFILSPIERLEPPAAEEDGRLEQPEEEPSAIATASPGEVEKKIRLRLQPILFDFPPNLEPASMHTLLGTEADVDLPLDLILLQLVHGRVVVPAEIFSRGLPDDLKVHFASLDPAAEIPIPLQEVFARLPSEAIKLREDQELDGPAEPIATPFAEQVEEDGKRIQEIEAEATSAAEEQSPSTKSEPPAVIVESNSQRLQAIFMTDEPLDLAKTIRKVAELPGLRSCLLSTADGLKLAGSFGDPKKEQTVATMLPDLFQRTRSQLKELGSDALETITLYYGLYQLSAFVQGELCLTVLHDNRPFKPGVREKIQAIISELSLLSTAGKPL